VLYIYFFQCMIYLIQYDLFNFSNIVGEENTFAKLMDSSKEIIIISKIKMMFSGMIIVFIK